MMKKVTILITFSCPEDLFPFMQTLERDRFPSGYELAHILKHVRASDAFTEVLFGDDVPDGK